MYETQLSIVIVNYNVKYFLQQCLYSVRAATQGLETDIYVVDNHSTDQSVEYLRPLFPEVTFIENTENVGFAKANNQALRICKGEYVLILNPDTVIGEESLRSLYFFMEDHPEAGALGLKMINGNGIFLAESKRSFPTPWVSFCKLFGLSKLFPNSPKYASYALPYLSPDEQHEVDVLCGAFMLMRHEALDKIGLLDEDFFMYGEDIDLSYRLLIEGFENWYLPTRILHYKGESTQKSSFRYVHVFYKAMLVFFRKHYGHLGFWLSIPINVAIYTKATFELARMSHRYINKMLGFRGARRKTTPHYLFLGSAQSLASCRLIAEKKGLEADYIECDESSNPDGHLNSLSEGSKANPVYVVYDTSSYKYEKILEIFSRHPCKYVFIGTYNPKYNFIITDKEIIN